MREYVEEKLEINRRKTNRLTIIHGVTERNAEQEIDDVVTILRDDLKLDC